MSTSLIRAVESDTKVSQRTVMVEMENMENVLPLKQNAGPNIDPFTRLRDAHRKREMRK